MRRPGWLVWMAAGVAALCGRVVVGQAAPAKMPVSIPAPAGPRDASLEAAEALIGRALFLRGFFTADDLAFDAAGRVQGTPKSGDWTLAGMDVQKAERRGLKMTYLEGVRVAIRYNQDSHQFERHPQSEEKMRMLVGDAGTAIGMETALDAIFAQGIDPGLQHSMPPFWQHYFNPVLEWPPDSLVGQTIYATNGLPNPAKDVIPPSLTHKVDLKTTPLSQKDKVRGTIQMRMIVDAEGVPRRITVVRPLGYGLEEQVVEAVVQWRFTPAMREGKPVAAALLLNLEIRLDPPPR